MLPSTSRSSSSSSNWYSSSISNIGSTTSTGIPRTRTVSSSAACRPPLLEKNKKRSRSGVVVGPGQMLNISWVVLLVILVIVVVEAVAVVVVVVVVVAVVCVVVVPAGPLSKKKR